MLLFKFRDAFQYSTRHLFSLFLQAVRFILTQIKLVIFTIFSNVCNFYNIAGHKIKQENH